MMPRTRRTAGALLLCTVIAIAGCSPNPERSSSALPTAPSSAGPGSLLGPTSVAPGGISGKFDVNFPPRNESFGFRTDLEGTYRTTLGRAVMQMYVDPEGEVVWTQEYLRYRTNGCSHEEAVERVRVQVNGQPAAAVCGAPPDGVIVFPPRDQSFDFRRRLETWYQSFNRGFSSSAVDPEGGVTWTQEYLRYRVNGCDNATATEKVMTQVHGGPVTPVCFVPPCLFTVAPDVQSVPAVGGGYTAVITRTSGDCDFGAESLAPWVRIVSGGSGSGGATTLTYGVERNGGPARTTHIRVRWTNNSTLLQINQEALTTAFTMTDPYNSPDNTTTCLIRSASTPCVFTASGNVQGPATYTWTASYVYGTTIVHSQSGTSPTFMFSQSCGGPGAAPGGAEAPLDVSLTVTDANGTTTVRTGVGNQPLLAIRFFPC